MNFLKNYDKGVSKKIYDPVHGFIHFNEIEGELISSVPMQRLYHIRQLGMAFLVYPGGTHSRFEHSLGVMELSSRIFDQIYKHPTDHMPEKGSPEQDYCRQVLRFAALCHDLGHLPFSHVAEKALLDSEGHEGWTRRMIHSNYLMPIWEKLDKSRDVASDVANLATNLTSDPWMRTLSHMITGDFFGSDRIDYLVRDAKATGLNYGLFDYHQMIEMMRILPALDPKDVIQLGIEENGLESCEALLIARHYMHKRIYKYPAVKAYAYHLEAFMKKTYGTSDIFKTIDTYLAMTDNEVLADINRARKDPDHPAHSDAIRLLQRKDHIVAIPIKKPITQELLQTLSKKHPISWELSPEKAKPMLLPFPVLMKNGQIQEGTTLSEMVIPKPAVNWIFANQSEANEIHASI